MSGMRKPILTNVCGIGSLYLNTMYNGFNCFIVYICEDESKRKYFCTLVFTNPPAVLIKQVSETKVTEFVKGNLSVLKAFSGSSKIIKVTSSDSVNWDKSEVIPFSELDSLRVMFDVCIPHVYYQC